MFHSFYSQISFVALFGCCGLALWKGGPAERGGAVLILCTWLVTMIALATMKQRVQADLFLASDAVLAIGLLILAVRFSSWWMGAAMLIQAVGLSLHAAYYTADKSELNISILDLYILGKNLASVAMLVVVLIATLVSWRKRSRASATRREKERPGGLISPAIL